MTIPHRRDQILAELGLTPLWRLRPGTSNHSSALTEENSLAQSTDAANPANLIEQESIDLDAGWNDLQSAVSHCTACQLHETRTQTVFGVGDRKADWLFIGEGPGATEDARGEPFVGQAGKLLDQMLAAIQLDRTHQVYITNIVKCRPPNNRNPSLNEARQCAPYLARQINLIQPKLIVALGKVAAQNLLNSDESIASLRGKVHSHLGIPLIVTYHPAYLLRSLPDKAKAWKDLCFAMNTMQSLS